MAVPPPPGCGPLAPIVQTLDGVIHWINLYPVDNAISFPNIYVSTQAALLGILGVGLPPRFSNPDPISEQKVSFSTPVFIHVMLLRLEDICVTP